MKRRLLALGAALCFCAQGYAQAEDWDDDFETFRKSVHREFEDFRREINEEYAAFLKNPWVEFKEEKPIPAPKEDPRPPVVYPKEDKEQPVPTPKPLPFDTVVPLPQPIPQPQPVEPIREMPVQVQIPEVKFDWFGTTMKVRSGRSSAFRLPSASENDVAKVWQTLSGQEYTNLLYDCLQLRRKHALGDYAYLQMLHSVATRICGEGTNEATLLMAYLYCQSGYKMRLARDVEGKLHMLYASRHYIYDVVYFRVEGEEYYVFGDGPSSMYISNTAFKGEQSLSLWLGDSPRLALTSTAPQTRQSDRYPEMKVTLTLNKNLIDLYSTYPPSMIGENIVSRWAMYANTPMSEEVKRQIYPDLKAAINGCDQLTAVNKLLNFVQTGFTYEYDDKVWGDDRAFFAEESLYYPYCDCEDRSILFTRLVRDLLGLRCILIYYPGHLASAVEFTQSSAPTGDYISLNGHKFVIADATYIGAPVGRTMPDMDNRTAKVILLE